MNRIILFSGTTEGRLLSEWLSAQKIHHTVCVATEYGRTVMEENEYAKVLTGRLDVDAMKELMQEDRIFATIDATHPYATEVSKNIKLAAKACNIRYIRLLRCALSDNSAADNCFIYDDNETCAKALLSTEGNILLTTGSKELHVYTEYEELSKRLFVRVLPGIESISLCEKAGISGKQIIAMQGPFSEELNIAIIKQFDIKHLVTKQSGKAGGFYEKIAAAEATDVTLHCIGLPTVEEGFSIDDVKMIIEKEV